MKQSRAILIWLGTAGLAFALGARFGAAPDTPAGLHHGEASAEHLATLLRTPDALERASELAAFFARASPDDARTFRDVMAANVRHVDEVAEVLLASWWSRTDPEAALRGRVSRPHGERDHWVQTVVREWTLRHPTAGLRAVMTEQVPPASQRVAGWTLIQSWFELPDSDPMELLPLFVQLDDDTRMRGEGITLLLNTMLQARGAEATIRLAEAVPVEQRALRREFLGRLTGALAHDHIEASLALLEKHARGKDKLVIERYLANDWGQADGPAALQWAANIESPNQPGTVKRAWRSFVRRDREAAMAWMRGQQPSPGLDPAYGEFLAMLAKTDPDGALALLPNLTDDHGRRSVLEVVGVSKMLADPEAAERWMDESELPAELRATIVRGAKSLSGRQRARAGNAPGGALKPANGFERRNE